MKHLRQYIRRVILESPELQGQLGQLVHNDEDPAYTIGVGDAHREFSKTFHRSTKPENIEKSFDLRRDVKKFWNDKADHDYWQNPNKIIAVHDLTYYSQLGDEEDDPEWTISKSEDDLTDKDLPVPMFMKKYPPGQTQKDEMSAYGFVGPIDGIFPLGFDLGIILNPRRVTFASAVDAYTESRGKASRKDKERHKSSGLPKRPRVGQYFDAGQILFDEADVMKAGVIGELVVDNWTYNGIVMNPEALGMHNSRLIYLKANLMGLNVYNSKTGEKL